MKVWKIILATLVIFAAGAVTGALFTRNTRPLPPIADQRDPLLFPFHVQDRFLGRMQNELELDPEQRARIEKIFRESRERMKIMFDLIGPELKTELRLVHDRVLTELNAEQREKFETLLKQRPHRGPRSPRNGERPPKPEPSGNPGF